MLRGQSPDAVKYAQRLKETYRARIDYYREAIYLLTGWVRGARAWDSVNSSVLPRPLLYCRVLAATFTRERAREN